MSFELETKVLIHMDSNLILISPFIFSLSYFENIFTFSTQEKQNKTKNMIKFCVNLV